jgi:hypothetical protein
LGSAFTSLGESSQKGPPTAAVQEADALIARLVADSQQHRVQRKQDPADPLRRAENAAVGLAGDVTEYSRWMVEIIRRYAERGDENEADYLADQLPGTGSALAWVELAQLAANKGKRERAEQCLIKLMGCLGSLSGQRAEEVYGRWAETLYVLDRNEEALAKAKMLSEVELLELDARLQAQGKAPLLNLEEAQARAQECRAKGVDRVRAQFLLSCAQHQFRKGSHAVALTILPEVGRLATSEGLPTAQRELIDLAKTAWNAGETAEAQKAMNVFFKCAELFPDGMEWKTIYLSEAALVLHDWKKADAVDAWLAKAEAGLPKVFVLDAPRAILALAKVREKVKGILEGDRLAMAAARAGMRHPHPAAQAAAAVRICLYYADAKRPIPEAAWTILNPTVKGN